MDFGEIDSNCFVQRTDLLYTVSSTGDWNEPVQLDKFVFVFVLWSM